MRPDFDFVETRFFEPLQHKAFLSLEHASYLKGFLKPFKGKGAQEELLLLCRQSEQLRDQLVILGRECVLAQVKTYPFALLPIQLALQTTGAGTAFLRWRKVDRSMMGVHLWEELICNQSTPSNMIADLYAIELQRIVLNMQVSLTHTIAKQARECALKVAYAQDVYQNRVK